jgi:hypothetical protein
MRDPHISLKHKTQTTVLFNWLLGCSVIFIVACVTYFYVGPVLGLEGALGFQITGLMVAVIIAHYSHRMFQLVKEIGEMEDDED